MTAATGMPKMAPGIPASLDPTITEPRTTTGWRPNASAIRRGWMTFISTNQPAIMMISTGSTALGTKKTATSTGGSHEMNGPKKGMAWSTPDEAAVTGMYGRPRSTLAAIETAA